MGVVIVKGEGAVFGVNLGCPIVTSRAFATQLCSNYFKDLLMLASHWSLAATRVSAQLVSILSSVWAQAARYVELIPRWWCVCKTDNTEHCCSHSTRRWAFLTINGMDVFFQTTFIHAECMTLAACLENNNNDPLTANVLQFHDRPFHVGYFQSTLLRWHLMQLRCRTKPL